MVNFLLAAADPMTMLYSLPLIVSVSLVYAATRHEDSGPILIHALRIGLWILGFMVALLAALGLVSWWL